MAYTKEPSVRDIQDFLGFTDRAGPKANDGILGDGTRAAMQIKIAEIQAQMVANGDLVPEGVDGVYGSGSRNAGDGTAFKKAMKDLGYDEAKTASFINALNSIHDDALAGNKEAVTVLQLPTDDPAAQEAINEYREKAIPVTPAPEPAPAPAPEPESSEPVPAPAEPPAAAPELTPTPAPESEPSPAPAEPAPVIEPERPPEETRIDPAFEITTIENDDGTKRIHVNHQGFTEAQALSYLNSPAIRAAIQFEMLAIAERDGTERASKDGLEKGTELDDPILKRANEIALEEWDKLYPAPQPESPTPQPDADDSAAVTPDSNIEFNLVTTEFEPLYFEAVHNGAEEQALAYIEQNEAKLRAQMEQQIRARTSDNDDESTLENINTLQLDVQKGIEHANALQPKDLVTARLNEMASEINFSLAIDLQEKIEERPPRPAIKPDPPEKPPKAPEATQPEPSEPEKPSVNTGTQTSEIPPELIKAAWNLAASRHGDEATRFLPHDGTRPDIEAILAKIPDDVLQNLRVPPVLVVLDPGESALNNGGALTPGAAEDGIAETDIVDPVLAETARQLREQHNTSVVFTREPNGILDDRFRRNKEVGSDELYGRGEFALALGDLLAKIDGKPPEIVYLSAHANGSKDPNARGAEIYTRSTVDVQNTNDLTRGINPKSTAFAQTLQNTVRFGGERLSGKTNNHATTRFDGEDGNIPLNENLSVALIELGYLTNAQDRETIRGIIADPKPLASQLATGISNYISTLQPALVASAELDKSMTNDPAVQALVATGLDRTLAEEIAAEADAMVTTSYVSTESARGQNIAYNDVSVAGNSYKILISADGNIVFTDTDGNRPQTDSEQVSLSTNLLQDENHEKTVQAAINQWLDPDQDGKIEQARFDHLQEQIKSQLANEATTFEGNTLTIIHSQANMYLHEIKQAGRINTKPTEVSMREKFSTARDHEGPDSLEHRGEQQIAEAENKITPIGSTFT